MKKLILLMPFILSLAQATTADTIKDLKKYFTLANKSSNLVVKVKPEEKFVVCKKVILSVYDKVNDINVDKEFIVCGNKIYLKVFEDRNGKILKASGKPYQNVKKEKIGKALKSYDKSVNLENIEKVVYIDLLCPYCEKYINDKVEKEKVGKEVIIVPIVVHPETKKATLYLLYKYKGDINSLSKYLYDFDKKYKSLEAKEREIKKLEEKYENLSDEEKEKAQKYLEQIKKGVNIIGTPGIYIYEKERMEYGY